MFKSKKYIEGMKDGAKPFEDVLNEAAENKEDMRKLVEIFGRRKTKKLLKIYMSNHPVKVKIVNSNNKDYDMADNLRKTLNEKRFDSSLCTYNEYKSVGRGLAAYVIFTEDYEKLIDGKSKIIYEDKFGCKIYRKDNFIIALHDENVPMKIQHEFFKYYNNILNESVEENEKIKKELKKRKITLDDSSHDIKILDKAGEDQKRNSFMHLIHEMILLSMLPWGITNTAICAIALKLQEERADKKIISKAQKQILLVKLTDFMEEERYRMHNV